ncbi:MAG: response regulator transcription factor [Siculibacillus sp.]|nr:response regulator transcription factor [Siculibacillus sp.]
MRVLVVEDDREVANYLRLGLREFGVVVDVVADGRDAAEAARDPHYDALIVDRMLPGLDGLELIRRLRGEGVTTPVVILSALSHVDERIRGLKAGGDDYVAKPYVLAELHARLEAVVRRRSVPVPRTRLEVGDLILDLGTRSASRAGAAVHLHPREFMLLEYLMRHAGQVVTRTMLREAVWDYHFHPQTNTLDVHISRLRQKIETDPEKPMLITVRGAGYCLRAP